MKISRILLILFLVGCNRVNETDVVNITNNNEVFSPGDTCIIELYVPFDKPNWPAFYILDGVDTLALPFDNQKGCAVYKALHMKEKKHSYAGYVLYISPDKKKKKSTFKINYEIRR